jgi:dienelactone hydrolase
MKSANTLPLTLIILLTLSSLAFGALPPTPPGQATTGYGSTQNYISNKASEYILGNARDGSRVWYYLPDRLRHETSAPVVIFLHGWTAYVPNYYQGIIDHLLRQGYIVIFPQFQKSGIIGVARDNDQNVFLARAVKAVNQALGAIGSKAERSAIYLSGHSLGGLLAFCWSYGQGVPAQALALFQAALDSADDTPESVPIVVLDQVACGQEMRAPVLLLTGQDDPLNPETLAAPGWLPNSPAVSVFMAISDSHGNPTISANHNAPLNAGGVADTLDYRYYYAALDAAIAGQLDVPFDLGKWSDGQAVTPVQKIYPTAMPGNIPARY